VSLIQILCGTLCQEPSVVSVALGRHDHQRVVARELLAETGRLLAIRTEGDVSAVARGRQITSLVTLIVYQALFERVDIDGLDGGLFPVVDLARLPEVP
jgi:hypothetical protein